MITQQDITEAHNRIKPFVHLTPVFTSTSLDEIAGCTLFFKCENFQKVGAFKSRGAMNAVLSLTREQRARGVATHSSGNHAQALARAPKHSSSCPGQPPRSRSRASLATEARFSNANRT